MVKRAFEFYFDSFRGFQPEIWWLALVTLINRAGTMVIPFLSLYLTADMGLTLKQVGWVMSAFGLGSVVGSWLGGQLSDRFGFYSIMFWSLVLSGLMFIALQFIRSFEGFCAAIFVIMLVADAFRPAMYVSLRAYSKPENRTRAVTLIRLAINLGFSAGPAIGGFIIAGIGYGGLFWVDGITCILAAIIFIAALSRKQSARQAREKQSSATGSPYRDGPYLLFLFIIFLIGLCFLQYFSTVPLYYRDAHHLSEQAIGLLLGGNGLLIFLVEMPLIKFVERPGFSRLSIMVSSTWMVALSFLVLNFTHWNGILIIGMLFMTIGEMLNFPFINRFALDRSERGRTGAYMGLFTISFSLAHIFGHNSGMQLVDALGYRATWFLMAGGLALAGALFFVLQRWIHTKEGRGEI